MRDLGQEPGAIARVVGRGRAAMGHSGHGLERHRHDFVGAGAAARGDEADAAGVVLAIGV